MQTYKFSDDPNKACIVCDHILNKERPILYVAHDNDGDWQFLCGDDDHHEGIAKVISLKQVTEIDESINDLYEMPTNVSAFRQSIGAKWQPFRLKS